MARLNKAEEDLKQKRIKSKIKTIFWNFADFFFFFFKFWTCWTPSGKSQINRKRQWCITSRTWISQ